MCVLRKDTWFCPNMYPSSSKRSFKNIQDVHRHFISGAIGHQLLWFWVRCLDNSWMDHYDIWYYQVPLRMDLNCNNFGVLFTFHQAPPAGRNVPSHQRVQYFGLWLCPFWTNEIPFIHSVCRPFILGGPKNTNPNKRLCLLENPSEFYASPLVRKNITCWFTWFCCHKLDWKLSWYLR